uniref:Ankyrin repeat-containing protein n=1 Tax=Tanacetum cinerariifolium TaxID=118510 RepID=A0A6L2JE68_TANCI|nr:ankyrin repeat-containing protein [Tanacetum cinerariifolium]
MNAPEDTTTMIDTEKSGEDCGNLDEFMVASDVEEAAIRTPIMVVIALQPPTTLPDDTITMIDTIKSGEDYGNLDEFMVTSDVEEAAITTPIMVVIGKADLMLGSEGKSIERVSLDPPARNKSVKKENIKSGITCEICFDSRVLKKEKKKTRNCRFTMTKVTDLEANLEQFKIEQAAINSEAAKQRALLQATIEKNKVESEQFPEIMNDLKALQLPTTLPEDTTTMIDTEKSGKDCGNLDEFMVASDVEEAAIKTPIMVVIGKADLMLGSEGKSIERVTLDPPAGNKSVEKENIKSGITCEEKFYQPYRRVVEQSDTNLSHTRLISVHKSKCRSHSKS